MEGLAVLIIILVIGGPILAIVLASVAMSRTTELRHRIIRLTRKIEDLERGAVRSAAPGAAASPPTTTSRLVESKQKRTGAAPMPTPTPTPTKPPVEPVATDKPEQAPPPPLPERDQLIEQLATDTTSEEPIELEPIEPAAAVSSDESRSLLGLDDPVKGDTFDSTPVTERKTTPTPAPKPKPIKPAKPKRPPISLEELLSTKVIVWIAAVAVALAGVFLVRYFVQQGLLTDELKVILAGGLGLALLTAGEFARRMRYGMIGQGLVASGFPVLYAAVLGAVQLYNLIPMTAGFGLLAAITVGAIFMSLRHGPLVALLGLIGGFLMPALIGAHEQSAAILFGYLFLLQIALLTLSRSRKWSWVTVLALIGGLLWAAGWIFFGYIPEQRGWVAMFLLSTVVAFVATTWRDEGGKAGGKADLATLVGWLAVPAALVMSAVLVRVGEFTNLDWAQLGLMSAAAIVMARLRGRYFPMACIAAGVVALLLFTWAGIPDAVGSTGAGGMNGYYLTIVGAFGLLFALGTYACMWVPVGSGAGERAGWWAYFSGIAGIGYGAIAYVHVDPAVLGAPWWVWTALAAGLYAALAIPVGARREDWAEQGDRATAGMIIAATFCASAAGWLAVDTLAYHPGLIAILWAAQLPVLAFLAVRFKLADLHVATGFVAIAVGARLLLNPNVLEYPIGTTPVLNWLLVGYGVPCVALALTAWILRKHEKGALTPFYEVGAAVVAFAMASLMVRHGFHADDLTASGAELYELSTYAVTWGGLAVVLGALSLRLDRTVLRGAAVASAVAMVGLMVFGPLLSVNPIVEPFDVGSTPVLNGLLYIYGVPALLALGMGTLVVSRGSEVAGRVLQLAGSVFAFAMVSLMIRHGFDVDWNVVEINAYEWATYAAVWGAISIVLSGVTLALRRPMLTAASMVMLTLALGATFLGPVFVANPLFTGDPVGATRVFNGLLYFYGLPALIALVSARLVHYRGGQRGTVVLCGLVGLALCFILVTLEVRHAFVGPILEGPSPTDAEGYAYSAAWIGFALVLLAAALLIRTPIKAPLRWSSLAVMLIAVGKVFLYDTRHLEDLWRVMSFLGLGITLFAVAWVYQRYVFGRRDGDDGDGDEDGGDGEEEDEPGPLTA